MSLWAGLPLINPAEIYLLQPLLWDFFIYILIFLGLTNYVFKQKYDAKHGKWVAVGVGLALSFGMIVWEYSMGWFIGSAPFAVLPVSILALIFALLFYRVFHAIMGMEPKCAAALTYLLTYWGIDALFGAPFDSALALYPLAWTLLALLVIVAIIVLVTCITGFFGGGGDGDGSINPLNPRDEDDDERTPPLVVRIASPSGDHVKTDHEEYPIEAEISGGDGNYTWTIEMREKRFRSWTRIHAGKGADARTTAKLVDGENHIRVRAWDGSGKKSSKDVWIGMATEHGTIWGYAQDQHGNPVPKDDIDKVILADMSSPPNPWMHDGKGFVADVGEKSGKTVFIIEEVPLDTPFQVMGTLKDGTPGKQSAHPVPPGTSITKSSNPLHPVTVEFSGGTPPPPPPGTGIIEGFVVFDDNSAVPPKGLHVYLCEPGKSSEPIMDSSGNHITGRIAVRSGRTYFLCTGVPFGVDCEVTAYTDDKSHALGRTVPGSVPSFPIHLDPSNNHVRNALVMIQRKTITGGTIKGSLFFEDGSPIPEPAVKLVYLCEPGKPSERLVDASGNPVVGGLHTDARGTHFTCTGIPFDTDFEAVAVTDDPAHPFGRTVPASVPHFPMNLPSGSAHLTGVRVVVDRGSAGKPDITITDPVKDGQKFPDGTNVPIEAMISKGTAPYQWDAGIFDDKGKFMRKLGKGNTPDKVSFSTGSLAVGTYDVVVEAEDNARKKAAPAIRKIIIGKGTPPPPPAAKLRIVPKGPKGSWKEHIGSVETLRYNDEMTNSTPVLFRIQRDGGKGRAPHMRFMLAVEVRDPSKGTYVLSSTQIQNLGILLKYYNTNDEEEDIGSMYYRGKYLWTDSIQAASSAWKSIQVWLGKHNDSGSLFDALGLTDGSSLRFILSGLLFPDKATADRGEPANAWSYNVRAIELIRGARPPGGSGPGFKV